MILYLDTSALVKLVLDEPGAPETRAWYAQAQQACCSVITYPEATAALCRHDRELGTADERLSAWLAALEKCWRRCLRAPVFERSAARLAITHALRGMDAVQLASACTLRDRVVGSTPDADFRFLAFDRRLLEAAEREGFATLGDTTE